jgi:hypothetical protein
MPSVRRRNTPPGLSFQAAQRPRQQRRELRLKFVEIVGRVLAEDDDVGAQALHPPALLREQHLSHERRASTPPMRTTTMGRSPEIP